jgi:hypothetical protein
MHSPLTEQPLEVTAMNPYSIAPVRRPSTPSVPAAARREEVDPELPEFVSVAVWCRRVGCSLDAGYRAARNNEIPGLFRIGRILRIKWPAFVASTRPR